MTKRTLKKFDKRRGERHYADYHRKLKNGTYARQDWFRRNNVFIFDGICKVIDRIMPDIANDSFSKLADVGDLEVSGYSDEYLKTRRAAETEWPDWKKEFYNNSFATSAHARKLDLLSKGDANQNNI